jgi:hypothetical protein
VQDVEELLRQDRMAGLTRPPDVSDTVKAVRRRLERQPDTRSIVPPLAWEVPLFSATAGAIFLAILLALGLERTWIVALVTAVESSQLALTWLCATAGGALVATAIIPAVWWSRKEEVS